MKNIKLTSLGVDGEQKASLASKIKSTPVTKCPKCGLKYTDMREECVCGNKTESSEIK